MCRSFVGLPLDEPVFDASVYSKIRMLVAEVAGLATAEVGIERPLKHRWHPDRGWAPMKSFRPKREEQGAATELRGPS